MQTIFAHLQKKGLTRAAEGRGIRQTLAKIRRKVYNKGRKGENG